MASTGQSVRQSAVGAAMDSRSIRRPPLAHVVDGQVRMRRSTRPTIAYRPSTKRISVMLGDRTWSAPCPVFSGAM